MDIKAPDSRSVIILHPGVESLKAETEKLRREISMLVLERDELLAHVCKDIEMAYLLTFGELECKEYELECNIRRLKRKMELIQAKKNRQEKVILSQIEGVLDLEFFEYQEKLDERISKLQAAKILENMPLLTEEASRELKKLYYAIVKVLHPDLHSDLSEEKLRLFHSAVEAYEKCDLDGLRIIEAMVLTSALPSEKSNELDVLMKQKDSLITLIHTVKSRIMEIKSQYPYMMKSLLESREKIEARKIELLSNIERLGEFSAAYTERIKILLGESYEQ